MRARILHAIELLSKWGSAVKPPEKTISAHDAMGGGDVMGGGEHGGKNGWSYSFGKWPNQVQQPQPQPQAQTSSVQFPIPPPAPAPAPVNVRDWAKDDNSPPRESPRSRQSSTGKSREIFIPPDTDWINPNHAPPVSFRPRSRNSTPDPVDDRWYQSNNFHSGPRIPRADPYSLESFDRSINSMLHQSHHRTANMTIPSNTQPVIPIGLARKQKEKRRKKDRERERRSKWTGHWDGDTSDSSDSDEEEQSSRRIPPYYLAPATATTTPHQQPPQIRIAPPMHPQNRSHSQQDPPNHHPTHHNLTSPIPIPVPVTNHTMHVGLHSPPQSFGPAQLAQYQFEQQQHVYQFQKQQQEQQQQQQQRYHHQQQPPPSQQQQQQQYYHQQQQQQRQQHAGVAIYR